MRRRSTRGAGSAPRPAPRAPPPGSRPPDFRRRRDAALARAGAFPPPPPPPPQRARAERSDRAAPPGPGRGHGEWGRAPASSAGSAAAGWPGAGGRCLPGGCGAGSTWRPGGRGCGRLRVSCPLRVSCALPRREEGAWGSLVTGGPLSRPGPVYPGPAVPPPGAEACARPGQGCGGVPGQLAGHRGAGPALLGVWSVGLGCGHGSRRRCRSASAGR